MQKDFELITKKFTGNEDIHIVPISDVHLGASEHMNEKWDKFCKEILSRENTFVTLGGDLINNATRNSVSNIYEDKLSPHEQKILMAKMLEPFRDRILCAVSGNHERRSVKDVDDDPTYDILCKLDLENVYRQNMAFVKVQIGAGNTSGNKRQTYVLTVTHGAGGGGGTGSAVNKNEHFGYALDGVDCLIVGHTHKPFVTQPSKIYVDTHNNRISFKPMKVVSSTSWLDYGGYAAQKMLLPTSHTPQTITLCGDKKEILVTM